MFSHEWIRPTDKVLTAAEVRKLPVGSMVTLMGSDRRGECIWQNWTVCQYGKGKALKTFNPVSGTNEVKLIKDYPNKRYIIRPHVTSL